MNSNLGKTLIYFGIIALGTIFLIYFFKTFTVQDKGSEISEVSSVVVKTKVEGDIDLKIFENDKFVNLKYGKDREIFFKAGRRDPFEPYE